MRLHHLYLSNPLTKSIINMTFRCFCGAGMADPAPVAQTFFMDGTCEERFRLDGIVTLVDAKHIE